jgi:hypothetical protein
LYISASYVHFGYQKSKTVALNTPSQSERKMQPLTINQIRGPIAANQIRGPPSR